MRRATFTILAGAAVGLLLATALRALLSTLFYQSLATLRLNGTASWTLVLLAPLLAPLVPRTRWPAVLAALATASLPFLRFTPGYVPAAALAAAAGLLALAHASRPALLGALAGLALGGALLLLDASHDPLLSAWGGLVALGLALLLLARPDVEDDEPRRLPAGVAWACLLAAQVAFLAAPYTLARHFDAPVWTVVAAMLPGLALGLLLPRRVPGGLLLAAGLAALLDVALLRGPLVLLSLAALQAALAASAARLPLPHGATLGPALAGILFGLLFFGQPLGPAEWGAALPALGAVALLGALALAQRPILPRAPTLAVALLGLLALPAALPLPTMDDAPMREVSSAPGAFTVVNWNVHQGFGNRGALDPAAYADALRAMAPDVLVLEESETSRLSSGGLDVLAYLERELGLRPLTEGGSVAILSRFPVAPGWVAPETPHWTARVALDVDGTVVHVQGVHLARSATERAAQAREILRVANETPFPLVLAGDLNSCPAATCFGGRASDNVHATLAAAYQDAWVLGRAPDDPDGFTHSAANPRRRIDVVLVRGLDVLEAGPVRDEWTLRGSDHLPVKARLVLRDGAPT